jgi:hypothetical protein
MLKLWKDIDETILKSLPNPGRGYEQKIVIPEFTFLGVKDQPDFGVMTLWFYGGGQAPHSPPPLGGSSGHHPQQAGASSGHHPPQVGGYGGRAPQS